MHFNAWSCAYYSLNPQKCMNETRINTETNVVHELHLGLLEMRLQLAERILCKSSVSASGSR